MALGTVSKILIAGGILALAGGALHIHRSTGPEAMSWRARELRSRGETYPALRLFEQAQAEARARGRDDLVRSLETVLTELREEVRQQHAEAATEHLRRLHEEGSAGNWWGVVQQYQAAEREVSASGDAALAERFRNVSDSPHMAAARVAEAYHTWKPYSQGHGADPLVGLLVAGQLPNRLRQFPDLQRAYRALLDARDGGGDVEGKEKAFLAAIEASMRDLHQVDPSSQPWPASGRGREERTARRVSPAAPPAAVAELDSEDLRRADS